ncbi:MAG: hypothetical protein ACE5JN_08750 [Candidatus Methylomirabilia bacterium]
MTTVLSGLLLGGAVWMAAAEEWGGVTPGVSTVDSVRARFGEPSRGSEGTLEGYATMQWVYEGEQAPRGFERMTVDFGLLIPEGYRPRLVRLLLLKPKPGIFRRRTLIMGWGRPDGVNVQDGRKVYFYRNGLVVFFDERGEEAVSMLFTIPQRAALSPTSK